MIVKPTNPKTETIYRIITGDNYVKLLSPARNDNLIDIVKSLHFKWYGVWQRIIDTFAGTVEDRAAELGSHLLANGFVVEIPDDLYLKIANQTYKPECKQWVLIGQGEYKNWFRLWWKRSENDFWNTTRQFLSDNRYDHQTKCICVPSEHFAEVEDFAQINNFQFSAKAVNLLDQAKKRQTQFVTVNIQLKEPEQHELVKAKVNWIEKIYDLPYRDFTITTITKLYDHQEAAVRKTLPLYIGALFMEMGTGKTRTAIELVYRRQHRIRNVVWFCPVSLKETIVHEIKKHTNSPEGQIIKFDDQTTINNIETAFWNIIGIESMSSSDRVVLTANHIIDEYSFVIVDESSYIKTHNSIRSRRITDLSAWARYRLILTGTPLSQGVVDLYSQMYFLDPGILGYHSFYSFASNHLEYSDKYPDLIVRSHNSGLLADKIEPFTYQVTKEECLDLPDKVFDTIQFGMTLEQRIAYEQTKWDLLLSLDIDQINSHTIFRLFSALQQIVSGFLKEGDFYQEFSHCRLDTLLSLIDCLPEDKKIIIWCKYRYSLKTIAAALDGVSLFYGDLNEADRSAELEKFRGENRFFVATQATGGHGLTLNETHYVIFYENEFKYANRLQAEDRCHRIGQEHKVTYIDIGCANSIDDRITDSLAKKGNLVQDFKRELDNIKDKTKMAKTL